MHKIHYTLPVQNLLLHVVPTTANIATIYLALSAQTSRPSMFFSSTPGFWLNKYTHEDLEAHESQVTILLICESNLNATCKGSLLLVHAEVKNMIRLRSGSEIASFPYKPTFTFKSSLLRCAPGRAGL